MEILGLVVIPLHSSLQHCKKVKGPEGDFVPFYASLPQPLLVIVIFCVVMEAWLIVQYWKLAFVPSLSHAPVIPSQPLDSSPLSASPWNVHRWETA